MSRPNKSELLAASRTALDLSEKFLHRAEEFNRGAEQVDRQIGMHRVSWSAGDIDTVRRLIETRDWALEQAYEHASASKKYLKTAKRLARRVKWARRG